MQALVSFGVRSASATGVHYDVMDTLSAPTARPFSLWYQRNRRPGHSCRRVDDSLALSQLIRMCEHVCVSRPSVESRTAANDTCPTIRPDPSNSLFAFSSFDLLHYTTSATVAAFGPDRERRRPPSDDCTQVRVPVRQGNLRFEPAKGGHSVALER